MTGITRPGYLTECGPERRRVAPVERRVESGQRLPDELLGLLSEIRPA